MDFLAKHWGDLAGVLGLAYTIWLAYKAKTAAEQARDAAQQVRERISALDTVGELSMAITILQEIMRLQRTHAWETVWDIVLDRYTVVRSHLVRSQQGAGISDFHRRSIGTAIAKLVIIVQEIETARTPEEQVQHGEIQSNHSDQIGAIERARIDLKTES